MSDNGKGLLVDFKECKYCGEKRLARLVRTVTNSGVSQVYWECQICKRNAYGGGTYISHEKIAKYGLPINNIPVAQDYRMDKCAVCGEIGTELHHFAPRYLFGDDAEVWPTVYLCRKHHSEWHNKVTPNMSQGGMD